jgi:hypothetical protein
MPSKTDIPPVDIETEYDEEGRGELSVYAAIQQPDGNHIGATETVSPDATPGQVAAALARVVTGLAAAIGPEMAEQMSMRIVDPDQPAAQLHGSAPGLTVSILDQWAADYRAIHGATRPLWVGVGRHPQTGAPMQVDYYTARALLTLAGAL